jgi:oxygen-dependent protoporphyrinogen oxidase
VNAPRQTAHVAVVGGGISGLAGAHRLRALLGPNVRITLVEQADRLGGVLHTVDLAGVPMDVGAEAFLVRRPEIPTLLDELGLADQLVHPATAAAPTVRAGGRTVPLPARTMLGVPGSGTRLNGLLSPAGLAQVAAERTRPLSWSGEDTSLGELLRDRFGDELTDRLVDPLLGGVYAGRVDGLGMRATMPVLAAELDNGARSLTAAVDSLAPRGGADRPTAPVFGALHGGYRVLIDALAAAAGVELKLGLPVRELTRRPRGWRLEIGSAAGGARGSEALDVDAVLLAVPAPALRKLLADVAPVAAAAAGEVRLASPVVIALAYRPRDARTLPTSSGVLVAADEPLRVKAFTHTARKWPHLQAEATDGLVRLRASLGRAGDAARLRVPDEQLVAHSRADLATLTGITAVPVDVRVQRWGGGLPQYGVGHDELVDKLERAVAALPGVAVAGSILHGVGVPACVGTGRAAAERIVGELSRSGGELSRADAG